MNRTQVLEAIVANRLEHLRAPLRDLLRPAIRVTLSASKRKRALGSSRFGGLPDLPPRSNWPTVDGIPLMFAGQVALKDVVRFKAAQALPKHGSLPSHGDDRSDAGRTHGRKKAAHEAHDEREHEAGQQNAGRGLERKDDLRPRREVHHRKLLAAKGE